VIIWSIIYAAALVWISALVQHANNLRTVGTEWVMSDRARPIGDDGFTGRAARTLRNNMESAAMYVPIALAAVALHQTAAVASWAAIVYMIVRTTFTLGYWLKINTLRSLSWVVGMACIAVLAITVLTATVAAG